MNVGPPRLVSVIAPCRNERDHVRAFCDAVVSQELPPGVSLEALIADGESDDGTRDLLLMICAEDNRLVLVENPGRTVSCGLNRCLERARGDVIVRMDIHTVYATDYIAQCLAALQTTGADNVGGPWRAVAHDGLPWQRAIAAAFQSRWLAGGARSRQLEYNGWVDTVYLGCWPRATFERFGGFDEELVRNQDDEHNLRIVLGGGRVWQSAQVRSRYVPRNSVGALFRQYLQYGYWKPFVIRKHRRPASLRHLVPTALVLALAMALTVALFGGPVWPLGAVGGAYAVLVLLSALAIAGANSWDLLPRLPPLLAAYHLGYGLGGLLGWYDVVRGAPPRNEHFTNLTR
jgi:succinoglycan biosynthesis protein ExoA